MTVVTLTMRSPSSWVPLALLVALYAATVGWNFHLEQIKNPDEPRYAVPARHMARGETDWLVPKFNGEPRTVKPILIYWLLAVAAKISLWLNAPDMGAAMRLVPILAGLLTVLATYGFGRRLFGTRVGLFAGMVLTTTLYFHETTREIVTDPLLTAFLTAAWYGFACATTQLQAQPTRTPWAPLLGVYLSLGLACLTKGPALVAVFAAIPMTAYLVWERKRYFSESGIARSVLIRTGLAWGLPLALLIGLSWHVMLCCAGQMDTVWNDFMEQNVQRALGQLDKNTGIKAFPWLYYIRDLPGKFIPWSIFFIPALCWSWRARKNVSAPARMLLCALGVSFLLIGLPASKRSLYLLPLYPMCAVWIALVWDRLMSKTDAPSILKRIWAGLCELVLIAACAVVGVFGLSGLLGWEVMSPLTSFEVTQIGFLGLGLVALAFLVVRCHRRGQFEAGSMLVLFAVAWLQLGYEQIVKPAGLRADGRVEFYEEVRGVVEDHPLVWLGGRCSEAVWYLDKEVPNLRHLKNVQAGFFEVPDAIMIVKKKILDDSPDLQARVRVLKVLRVKGKDYALVHSTS